MKKLKKNYFILILSFLFMLNFLSNSAIAVVSSEVHIIQDSHVICSLPSSFRKTTDISKLVKFKFLDLTGLDTLNISGSGQFTRDNLSLIKNEIETDMHIIDIDLREESHGFADNIPISFANKNNNANKGLSYGEIIDKENSDLSSITPNCPLTLYNTDKTINPSNIENECMLTKSNNIEYIRIPVTDGGLPSEDKVKYFLDFINKKRENSWLHFHCKAGVGRTTTFMIMYDIIENCNKVNLNDIIARQTLLASLPPKDLADFFVSRRYKFLKEFYDKCKNNDSQDCYANLNNGCINSDIITDNQNTYYIKNNIMPKILYVINENDMTKAEQTMIATLQGLIASRTDNAIYILSPSEPDYEIWLKDLKSCHKIKYKMIDDPWELINKFKKFITGYVLYSSSKPPSINNACTMASLKDSIAIDESIEWILNKHGINNLIKDCRDTDKYWAFDNLWDCGLNHSTVIELSPDKLAPLRDYAVLSKSLIFYEDDVNDYELRERIFSSMSHNGRILGWGPDEHGNVSLASKYGIDMTASDWAYNLSVLSSFKSEPYTLEKDDKDNKNQDGFHYVTFIMSDGDNMQWLLGSNYSNKNWFGSPYRKDFTLGWSLNPSLYYLAPTVFNSYYKSDNYNNFVTAPSGNGYMYPSKFPQDRLESYTKTLNDYMKLVNQHYVLILDDEAFYRNDVWDKYTCHSNIDGLLYLNYDKNNSYEGKITWSNNKPVVSCRDLLWAGLEDENTLIDNINDRILNGYTKINDINSYTFVYVHVWSNTMDNVYNVVNKLNSNPKVRIVSPNDFMDFIKNNVTDI